MGNRILVVAADQAEVHRLRQSLSANIWSTCVLAWSGSMAGARAQLATLKSDLIMVDCSLPDSNGIDSFERLRDVAPHTPILTLHDDELDLLALNARAKGSAGFVFRDSYDHYLLPQVLGSLMRVRETAERFELHRARAETTLNSIDDGVISIRQDGRIDYLNPAAAQICGWDAALALGRPARDVLSWSPRAPTYPSAIRSMWCWNSTR